jgi:hypothetical protein
MKKDLETERPHRTKIFKFYSLPTNGTFAFPPDTQANASHPTEPLLADPNFFNIFGLLIN